MSFRSGGLIKFLFSWQYWKAVLFLNAFLIVGQALVVRIWHPHLKWPADSFVQAAIMSVGLWIAMAINHYRANRNIRNDRDLGARP